MTQTLFVPINWEKKRTYTAVTAKTLGLCQSRDRRDKNCNFYCGIEQVSFPFCSDNQTRRVHRAVSSSGLSLAWAAGVPASPGLATTQKRPGGVSWTWGWPCHRGMEAGLRKQNHLLGFRFQRPSQGGHRAVPTGSLWTPLGTCFVTHPCNLLGCPAAPLQWSCSWS